MRAILLLCVATACSSTSENPAPSGTGGSAGGSSTGGVTSGGGSGGVAGTAASGGAAGVTNTGGFAAVAGSAGAAGGTSLGVDCNFAFNYDSTTGLATYCTAAGCTVKLTVMCNGLQGSTYTADPAADTCPAGVNYEATIDVSQCSTADIAIQLDCGTTAKGSCKVK